MRGARSAIWTAGLRPACGRDGRGPDVGRQRLAERKPMKRRELMLLMGGMMVVPHALRAQQKAMPVIGFLHGGSPGPTAANLAAFHRGLSENGYVVGQNLAIEYRWAEARYDRLPALATDLVNRKVDVIVGAAPL